MEGILLKQIISVRFNEAEFRDLNKICRKYKIKNKSTFMKELLFTDIKTFLSPDERFLLETTIMELNALGKNLNQLLKYRAYHNAQSVVNRIKQKVEEIEKIL